MASINQVKEYVNQKFAEYVPPVVTPPLSVSILYADLVTLKQNNMLQPIQYFISDKNVYIKAINGNTFDIKGIGKFYDINYDPTNTFLDFTSETAGTVWKPYMSVIQGKYYPYNNEYYMSVNGINNDTAPNMSPNFVLVPKDETNSNVVYNNIEYIFDADYIQYREDMYGNKVRYDYSLFLQNGLNDDNNIVKYFIWGRNNSMFIFNEMNNSIVNKICNNYFVFFAYNKFYTSSNIILEYLYGVTIAANVVDDLSTLTVRLLDAMDGMYGILMVLSKLISQTSFTINTNNSIIDMNMLNTKGDVVFINTNLENTNVTINFNTNVICDFSFNNINKSTITLPISGTSVLIYNTINHFNFGINDSSFLNTSINFKNAIFNYGTINITFLQNDITLSLDGGNIVNSSITYNSSNSINFINFNSNSSVISYTNSGVLMGNNLSYNNIILNYIINADVDLKYLIYNLNTQAQVANTITYNTPTTLSNEFYIKLIAQ